MEYIVVALILVALMWPEQTGTILRYVVQFTLLCAVALMFGMMLALA